MTFERTADRDTASSDGEAAPRTGKPGGPPLWTLTATALAAGYETGRFSPRDVMDAVFDRLDAVNPVLNAVIAVDRDGACLAADAASLRWRAGTPLSRLDGVPITVKDSLLAKGLPATWGSRLHAGAMADHDEAPVARLRAAGAIVFGKTNVPEFTVQGYTSNALFGTTLNPHAPGRTPGGSTGGGAAAVAAGIGPIALGTDAGGSLRRPAAHCGLYALKPSIGQVPRHGGFPQFVLDLEVVGPLARSAEDLELARAVLSGFNPADSSSLAAMAPAEAIPDRPRIAFLPAIGDNPVDPRISDATAALARSLADHGAIIETIPAPYDAEALATAWNVIVAAGLAWYLARFDDAAEMVGDNARALLEAGRALPAGNLLDAIALVRAMRADAGRLLADYDLLLAPATAALAWPADAAFPKRINGREVGPRGHAVFTGWMNATGLPAVTVPLAMTAEDGGIGIQLVAGHGRDAALVDFVRRAPALAGLSPAPLADNAGRAS